MRLSTLSFLFALSVSLFAVGNTQVTLDASLCTSILQAGIHDYFQSETSNSSAGNGSNGLCYNNNSTNQQGTGVNLTASYAGFGLGLGYNDSSLAGLAGSLCNSSSKDFNGTQFLQNVANVVDPSCIAAYNECVSELLNTTITLANANATLTETLQNDTLKASQAQGQSSSQDSSDDDILNSTPDLQVKSYLRPSDQAQVIFMLQYSAPSTSTLEGVSSIDISPSASWACAGALWELSQNASNNLIPIHGSIMACSRNVSGSAFSYMGKSVYATASTITIFTSEGGFIQQDFDALAAN